MNLLVITQKVDENDDLLGFFIGWLRVFSKKFDNVFVITLAKGENNLPSNVFVYSLGKERNNSKIARLWNYYKFLFKLVPKADGIFTHMSPIFAISAWPVAAIFRERIILWYSHRSVTHRLKLATLLAYKIFTASPSSFLLNTPKKIITGHGIDTNYFKLSDRKIDPQNVKLVSVGRISSIKDYITVIKAVKILKESGYNVNLKIIGRPIYETDKGYLSEMNKLIRELNLADAVKISDFIPFSKISNLYQENDILINASPTGGIDKVVLEAMASGIPVFTANEGFSDYLGDYRKNLLFKYGNEEDLSRKLESYIRNPLNVGIELREIVKEKHNLTNIIDKISETFK